MRRLLAIAALVVVGTACQPLPNIVIPPAPESGPSISVSEHCDHLDYTASGFGYDVLYISITELWALDAYPTPALGYETGQRFSGSIQGTVSLDGHFKHTYSVRTPGGVYQIGTTPAC